MGSPKEELTKMIRELAAETLANGGLSLSEADANKKTVVAEVIRTGTKLIIPEGMTLSDAKRSIEAKEQDEENRVKLSETFDVFVWEGAYAMARTLDVMYGWFNQVKIPGGFFEPDQPPALISVKIGPDTTVQIPWGRFTLPNMAKGDGYLETGYYAKPGEIPKFRLNGELKKKHSEQFHKLCAGIREQLKTVSLYKGKAITVKFYDADGDRLPFPEPDFTKINHLGKTDLIFSKHIEQAVDANLYTPMLKTEMCRQHGIPLKRAVALAGPFGTGKTLIAQRTATLAEETGWTFIFVPSTKDFPDCVRFAQRYQPAVVFCEDIDRSTSGERDEDMDDILNTIDGVNAKQTEIILVLTTNEVEDIHPAMLRPGRLDVIIHVDRPDAEAVERLVRLYAGDLLNPTDDLHRIGKALAGSTPAVIREVVERSKLAAIHLLDAGESFQLSEQALLIAADTMEMHRKLMDKGKKEPMQGMEVLGNVLGHFIGEAVENAMKQEPGAVSLLSSLPSHTPEAKIVRAVRPNGVATHSTTLDSAQV
jgi:transitional endoplasmic reticulum ATPase